MKTSRYPQKKLASLSTIIGNQTGLVIPPDRWKSLEDGIRSITGKFGFRSPEACLDWLTMAGHLSQAQIKILADHITIGETYFYREPQIFEILRNEVLVELIRRRRGSRRLRIWSAGCCTGEEPYSIAILLHEMIPDLKNWDVIVYGTDINIFFLRQAQEGAYREWSFRGTPDWLRRKYVSKAKKEKSERYVIDPSLKRIVRFSYLNLADPAAVMPEEKDVGTDIIFCRNVLMYFARHHIERVVNRFYQTLGEDGWLILSACENNFPVGSRFEAVRFSGATLFRKGEYEHQAAEISPAPVFSEQERTDCRKSTPDWFQGETCPLPAAGDREDWLERLFGPNGSLPREVTPPSEPVPDPPSEQQAEPPGLEPEQYRKARDLFEQGRLQEALTLLAPLEEERVTASGGAGYLLLARIKAGQGKLAVAITWCDRAIKLEKLNSVAHFVRASLLLENGDESEAAMTLKRVLYLDPDFVIAHFMLGNILFQQGKEVLARRSFNTVKMLLRDLPDENVLPESEGMTAGRLREIVGTMNGTAMKTASV